MSCDYTIDMSNPATVRCTKDETICWSNPAGGPTRTAATASPSDDWPWGGDSSITVAPGHTSEPYTCRSIGTYDYHISQDTETNPQIIVTANL